MNSRQNPRGISNSYIKSIVPDSRYYYGNGKTFGGFGVAPNQFLRFNPYLECVEDQNLEVPAVVKDWIEKNA